MESDTVEELDGIQKGDIVELALPAIDPPAEGRIACHAVVKSLDFNLLALVVQLEGTNVYTRVPIDRVLTIVRHIDP